MFRSPSLSCFCNSSSPVITSCQSATVRLRLRLRSCQCLHGFAICLSIISSPDPRSHPFSGFMAPLWVPGLLFRLRLRYCSVLSSSCSGATWILSTSPFIAISAFLSSLSISGVLAAQPASSFLASVYSTVVLLYTLLSSHLD
jgi:hypothetical protein